MVAKRAGDLIAGQLGTAEHESSTVMSDEPKESLSANELLKNSSLFREFLAVREEILKHKWIESEKEGRDIGFERALTDWIIKHRPTWRKCRHAATLHGHVIVPAT